MGGLAQASPIEQRPPLRSCHITIGTSQTPEINQCQTLLGINNGGANNISVRNKLITKHEVGYTFYVNFETVLLLGVIIMSANCRRYKDNCNGHCDSTLFNGKKLTRIRSSRAGRNHAVMEQFVVKSVRPTRWFIFIDRHGRIVSKVGVVQHLEHLISTHGEERRSHASYIL